MAKFDPNGASVPNYNRINEWPLQFLRTGNYARSYGYLSARAAGGYWWSDMAGLATGRYLDTWAGDVYAQHSTFRGYGFALRCVALIYLRSKKNAPKGDFGGFRQPRSGSARITPIVAYKPNKVMRFGVFLCKNSGWRSRGKNEQNISPDE